MKTVATSTPFASSYGDSVKVQQATGGRFKGKFRAVGCGYAGRTYYATAERAKAVVEADARFTGWQ